MGTGERLYLYPLWLRIWHAVNAVCILLLIYSGLSLHYSARSILLLDFQNAVPVHNVAGVVLSFNYLVFLLGNILTDNGKFYRVKINGLVSQVQNQVEYYVSGMFKGAHPPYPVNEKRKFNPLQKYAYIFVMYIVLPVLIITGFALIFPEIIFERIMNVSGIMLTALLHGIMGFFVFIFLLIHLYVASMGKSPVQSYKSIITGWHA